MAKVLRTAVVGLREQQEWEQLLHWLGVSPLSQSTVHTLGFRWVSIMVIEDLSQNVNFLCSEYTLCNLPQHYDDDVEKIPTGCITVEDAEMLWRMQSNGITTILSSYYNIPVFHCHYFVIYVGLDIAIHLEIESSPEGTTTTRNVVGEYPGSELPHQVR